MKNRKLLCTIVYPCFTKFGYLRLPRSSTLSILGSCRFGSSLSTLDYMQLGSCLSLRSFTRFASACSIVGMSRIGSCVSVLDFLALGSGISLRSFSPPGGSERTVLPAVA